MPQVWNRGFQNNERGNENTARLCDLWNASPYMQKSVSSWKQTIEEASFNLKLASSIYTTCAENLSSNILHNENYTQQLNIRKSPSILHTINRNKKLSFKLNAKHLKNKVLYKSTVC